MPSYCCEKEEEVYDQLGACDLKSEEESSDVCGNRTGATRSVGSFVRGPLKKKMLWQVLIFPAVNLYSIAPR